jgi:hypothetical protein
MFAIPPLESFLENTGTPYGVGTRDIASQTILNVTNIG